MDPTGSGAVEILGVTLVGVSTTTGVKLLFTLVLVLVVLGLRRLVLRLARRTLGGAVADDRRARLRPAAGHHRLRRLLRHPAR